MNVLSAQDYLTVAARGWTGSRKKTSIKKTRAYPIRRMLVIDTETLTDTSQALTFGSAQLVKIKWRRRTNGTHVYDGRDIETEVLFHADDLETTDLAGYLALVKYGADHNIPVVSRSAFVERYFRYHCQRRKSPKGKPLGTATAVFFNAPFDISRLAEDFGNGRRANKGGFSFRMAPLHNGAEDRFCPRINVHHIDSKKALVSWGFKSGLDALSDDDGSEYSGRGQFIDLRQLIWGMTNEATSLSRACKLFNLPPEHQKTHPNAHGKITPDYIDYNRQDVTATRELAVAVLREYVRHPIDLQPHKVFSPASLAKAYLRKMGITPMLDRPGFPDDKLILGNSISTFYGGRAECYIRRTSGPVQVCDFTSMYPTVNILMGLWDIITAESLSVVDCTDEIRALLDNVTIEWLLNRENWRSFVGMVQIVPDGTTLPVRANYEDVPGKYGVGQNLLHSDEPLWYTIPDVIAATLRDGKAPRIIRAVRFVPSASKLPSLRPVELFGHVHVDPAKTDFFKTVVEQRQTNRRECRKGAPDGCECERCRTQRFLKVLANAGSYGIFVEMLRKDLDTTRQFTVYGTHDQPWQSTTTAEEVSQEFCYPPIGATITGAARLMLAVLEKLVTDAGGTWLFCDTDSMAIVADKNGSLIPCKGGPHTMLDGQQAVRALTYEQVDQIRETINRLNPYDRDKVPDILKVEATCHGFMVSAKRYTLFHYDEQGRPIVPEKVDGKEAYSGHGLGPYLNPTDPESEDIGWIRQTWQYILNEAHGLKPPDPPWFDRPAMTRITVSSPHVMRSLDSLNEGKNYAEQVKPFNFILSTTENGVDAIEQGRPKQRYIAPYTSNPAGWESPEWTWHNANDPGAEPIGGDRFPFRRMRAIIGGYGMHSEYKSLGPDGLPCKINTVGLLGRRTVRIRQLVHIGKETNKFEDVLNHLYDDHGEDVLTEYRRKDIGPVADIIARYSRCKFAELVNVESATIRPGQARFYGEPVHVDRGVIERFARGHRIDERNRRAIVRTAAKLIAPTIGVDPKNIRQGNRRMDVRPETVIAMWRDAGKPSIGTPASCRCGCGHDAAPRSAYASKACRDRYNRWRRTQIVNTEIRD
jgi:hypothetical protein